MTVGQGPLPVSDRGRDRLAAAAAPRHPCSANAGRETRRGHSHRLLEQPQNTPPLPESEFGSAMRPLALGSHTAHAYTPALGPQLPFQATHQHLGQRSESYTGNFPQNHRPFPCQLRDLGGLQPLSRGSVHKGATVPFTFAFTFTTPTPLS